MKYSPEFIQLIAELKVILKEIALLPYSGCETDENGIDINDWGIEYHTCYRWNSGDTDTDTLCLTWEELNQPDPVEFFRKKFQAVRDKQVADDLAAKEKSAREHAERVEKIKNLKKDKDYEIYQALQRKFGNI